MSVNDDDFISLTDMLKAKDGDFFISDWLRNRNTVEPKSVDLYRIIEYFTEKYFFCVRSFENQKHPTFKTNHFYTIFMPNVICIMKTQLNID